MSGHPLPQQLDAYRAGALPPEELLRLDEHIATCADCRAALSKGAYGFVHAIAASAATEPAPAHRPGLRLAAGLALAASIAVVVWAPLSRRAEPGPPIQPLAPVESPGTLMGEPSVPAGLTIVSPQAGSVEANPPLFRWNAAGQGGPFEVTVADRAGDVILQSPPLEGTEWRAPRKLPAGRYAWQVKAGQQIAPRPPLPMATFTVR